MRRALLLLLAAALPASGEDRLPEFLKSDGGPAVHRSCLDGEGPAGRAELKARFEAAVAEALARTRACGKDLAELSYLSEALDAVPRLRLACADAATDPKFEDAATGAYTVHGEQLKSHPQLGPLAEKDPDGLFVVVRGGLRSLLDQGPLGAASLLFHEAHHHTKANNRWDHNALERVPVDPGQPCVRNKLDDRIILLEAACGFDLGAGSELLSRFRRCGAELGCETPLWMVANVPYPPSHPEARRYGADLMGDPARTGRICRRIERRLGLSARRGEISDREVTERLDLARRALLSIDAGLGPTIPPRYLEALTEPERAAAAAFPGLARDLDERCRRLVDRSVVDGRALRYLLPFDETKARAECPLAPAHAARGAALPFLRFHEAERALQKGARDLLARGDDFPLQEGDEPRALGVAAVSLFERHCPSSAYEFRPAQCDAGLAILLTAFADVETLLSR